MDQRELFASLFPASVSLGAHLGDGGFLTRMRAGAVAVYQLLGDDVFDVYQAWESDTARGWAAFAVGLRGGDPADQLGMALRFARDPHFGVREFAWLGVRAVVRDHPLEAIEFLSGHVADESALVRRFCVEATRPRGVWSAHVPLLKAEPEAGLPVLDPLAAAGERYVRESVANWLNDAARTRPDWVRGTCSRWVIEHGDGVQLMVRRAQRHL